jgi:hypothetical protein
MHVIIQRHNEEVVNACVAQGHKSKGRCALWRMVLPWVLLGCSNREFFTLSVSFFSLFKTTLFENRDSLIRGDVQAAQDCDTNA